MKIINIVKNHQSELNPLQPFPIYPKLFSRGGYRYVSPSAPMVSRHNALSSFPKYFWHWIWIRFHDKCDLYIQTTVKIAENSCKYKCFRMREPVGAKNFAIWFCRWCQLSHFCKNINLTHHDIPIKIAVCLIHLVDHNRKFYVYEIKMIKFRILLWSFLVRVEIIGNIEINFDIALIF